MTRCQMNEEFEKIWDEFWRKPNGKLDWYSVAKLFFTYGYEFARKEKNLNP